MLRRASPMLRFSAGAASSAAALPRSTAAVTRLSGCPDILRPLRSGQSRGMPVILRTQYSTKPFVPPTQINKGDEKKLAQQKIEARPDEVSSESSVRHFLEPAQEKTKVTNQDADEVLGDLKKDISHVVETVDLRAVPPNAYKLGLAGTVPYLFTSLSTVYLSWNLNTPWPTDNQLLNGFMVPNATASEWLQMLEPIQLGYGAVIISFLGAIHWGLELAEKTPAHPRTNFRYAIGVIAPIVAWPTLMLPIEWALTGQFAAFVGLYFADARATTRGWAPPWYSTYRFVLTAIVGSAIFVSLIGRFKVGDEGKALSTEGLRDTMTQNTAGAEPYSKKWAKKEEVEKERLRKKKEEEEKKRKEEEAKKKEEEEKRKEAEKKNKQGDKEKGKKGDEEKTKKGEDGSGEKKDDQKENKDDQKEKKDDQKEKGDDENKKDNKEQKSGDEKKNDEKEKEE